MFHVIHDILSLNFEQFFPLILLIHFKFQDKEENQKSLITDQLRELLIYTFRVITVKEGYPRVISTKLIFPLLNKMKSEEKLFFVENEKDDEANLIKKEFAKDSTERFYEM